MVICSHGREWALLRSGRKTRAGVARARMARGRAARERAEREPFVLRTYVVGRIGVKKLHTD